MFGNFFKTHVLSCTSPHIHMLYINHVRNISFAETKGTAKNHRNVIIEKSPVRDIQMEDEIITVTETKITIITKAMIRRNMVAVSIHHPVTEIDIIINHRGDKVLF